MWPVQKYLNENDCNSNNEEEESQAKTDRVRNGLSKEDSERFVDDDDDVSMQWV